MLYVLWFETVSHTMSLTHRCSLFISQSTRVKYIIISLVDVKQDCFQDPLFKLSRP
jgi:hypothetical protein